MTMAKYAPGAYHVILFDRFGGRKDVIQAKSLLDGQRIGNQQLKDNDVYGSFVVLRVVYNSLGHYARINDDNSEGEWQCS